MQYWDIVVRSFSIAWRHRYLWLLALFAGEGGGGFSGNYGQSSAGNASNRPNVSNVPGQVASWITDHAALLIALAVLALIVFIALFVLAAVCEGALVRASAEHDAERPFGLGIAWRCGVATMWTIVRLRLLVLLLGLPAFVLVALTVAAVVLFALGHNVAAAVAFGFVTLLVTIAAIVYAVYLSFLDRLGTRAVVLEQLTAARGALVRGHRLVRARFGRVLLVWLLSIAVAFVVGIAAAIVLGIVLVPFVLAAVAAYATHSAAFVVLIAVGVAIFLPVALVVSGFLQAQASTYWTLAFRRLELDAPPALAYQFAPPPASGA